MALAFWLGDLRLPNGHILFELLVQRDGKCAPCVMTMEHKMRAFTHPASPEFFEEEVESVEFAVGEELAWETGVDFFEGGNERPVHAEADGGMIRRVVAEDEMVGLVGEGSLEAGWQARHVETQVGLGDALIGDMRAGRLLVEPVSDPEIEAGGHFRKEVAAVSSVNRFDEVLFERAARFGASGEEAEQLSARGGIKGESRLAVLVLEEEPAFEGGEVVLVHPEKLR